MRGPTQSQIVTAIGPGAAVTDIDARLPAWALVEVMLAFMTTAIFYVGLYGELPFHDAARFTAEIDSGRFVWDIGHIFLQPSTLIWHRWLGFGETATESQKHINTFATSLGVAAFYATLLRLNVPRWQRVCGVALLIGSASLIILAPSAHMKLLTYPFINGAIYYSVLWEKRQRAGRTGQDQDLLVTGVLLAIAASFLASCLAAASFVALAAVLIRVRAGGSWRDGIATGFKFALVCGVLFVALACFGFITFTDLPLSLHGLSASVSDKAALSPKPMSLGVRLGRTVFGTANNLITAPAIGSIGRTWMGGEIIDLRPYYTTLASQILPWAFALSLIGCVYLATLRTAFRGTASLMLIAFLAGAQAWTVYFNLNDPEHWMLLSVPTILLLLTVFSSAITSWLAPLAAIMVLASNLLVIAIPTTRYPLLRYQAELTRQFAKGDLLVGFAAYPGGPYLGFFDLGPLQRLNLDQLLQDSPSVAEFYAEADRRFDETLARGGRVVVFGLFDPENWDAPWPEMARLGVPKAAFLAHFGSRFAVRPLGTIAELKAWELSAKAKVP